jgi:hypothetical protein
MGCKIYNKCNILNKIIQIIKSSNCYKEKKTKLELRWERVNHLKVILWVCILAIWKDPD